jgi:hypothetical protein
MTDPVDGPGNDFLPGAALAGDEHGGIVAGHAGGQLDHIAHRPALRDDQVAHRTDTEAGS